MATRLAVERDDSNNSARVVYYVKLKLRGRQLAPLVFVDELSDGATTFIARAIGIGQLEAVRVHDQLAVNTDVEEISWHFTSSDCVLLSSLWSFVVKLVELLSSRSLRG